MKGNIFSRQKCRICNGRFVHSERRSGLFCEKHRNEQAMRQFYVKFGREINRRFPIYEKAARFLNGLRYENDNGKFDVRDHLSSNPLGFANLAKQYLKFKKKQNLPSFRNIERYIDIAADHFKDLNVKTIKKRHIRDFLFGISDISEKTRANYASQIHDFYYNFLYDDEEILTLADLPKIPDIPFELGFRKIVDIDTREKIVNRLKDKTYFRNPKIWLAVDLLCSYNNIRPIDITRLKEGDIDLEYGIMTFWRPSKSKKKKIPQVIRIRLLDYHIEEFRRLKKSYSAIPDMPFFRHTKQSGIKADTPFSGNYLYKQWKKACSYFGIHDLDLYGGTRHSTTTAIAKEAGKKMARKFSGHNTNKAFDRYCQIGDEDSHDMAQLMATMRGTETIIDIKNGTKSRK